MQPVEEEEDVWEIQPSTIELGQQIGKGAFGRVHIGKMLLAGTRFAQTETSDENMGFAQTSKVVAVKILKSEYTHFTLKQR